ncbi:hypothetical protein ACFYZT_29760 [Streptomyces sp. NPDC001591]|uniref:hypothetical protein n=1 Tax=Streptomyces sp. NPDC001591 TaxID=3364589 RepID=UPI0036A4077B
MIPDELHWHAYAYTGRREDTPTNAEAPLDADDWLRRSPDEIVATFTEPEQAAAWMRQQLRAYPPWSEGDIGFADATLYTRQRLYAAQDQAPSASYPDRHGRIILRILAPCPRPRSTILPPEPYPWETPAPPCPLARPEP